MVNKRLGKSIETQIYKFPDDLISSMKSAAPDILALSNYDWNVNLNRALIKIGREINPQLFVVMGGPNIRKKPEGVKDFLTNHPCDMHVVNEGEEAFSNIVEYILGQWPCDIRKSVLSSGIKFENAAYLESETQNLMLGKKPASAHAKDIPFPSPYLTGLLDPFINNASFPLYPLLETNRNCPYQCHFCVWGDFELNKIRVFDFDTVIEELRYMSKNIKSQFKLGIADANFGILNRDILIAEEIRRLSDKYNKFDRIYIAQAKNSVKRNLEISKILGKLMYPDFAVQTLTPGILEHSGRKNLSNEDVQKYIDGVRKEGNEVMTDILVGLPGETKQQFIDSMKKVIDFGFLKAQVSDIRLLDGSVMAENDFKEKFGIESGLRVIPTAYGEYGGLKVIEYEKCIRKTNTMSTEDLLELRLFNTNFFLLYYLELGRPLVDFAKKNDVHPITLISDISKNVDKENYPVLAEYIKEYIKMANNEWYDSEQEADNYYLQPEIFNKLTKEGFPKLSYEFAAQLITKDDLRKEYLEWIGENIKRKLPNKELIINELVTFSVKRIYNLPFDSIQNAMEISFDSANHLVEYMNDYNYTNVDEEYKNAARKGEYRDTFDTVNLLKNKKEHSETFIKNSDKNSKIKIKFDIDKENTERLIKEIGRYGGQKDLNLAIQVVLQKNQKSFLRSWNIQY